MNPRAKDIKEDHVISAVSRSLEDALEAALRGAFEVALRIAVNDVSRLMGQALQDVKHQIHETQQENISLKLRLEQIHAEQDNKPNQQTADPNQSSIKSDKLHEDTPGNVCEKLSEEDDECVNKSFHEESDEGRLLSYKIHTSTIIERNTSYTEKGTMTHHTIQHVESSDPDPLLFQSGFEQVQVKNEKPEPEEPVLDGNSGYGSDARPDYTFDQRSNEEFGLDRLTLAQSKLLDDWRPDSDQQQNETEPLDQGSSLGTSEISLSSSGCVSSFSTSFDGLYQAADKTSLTQPLQICKDQMRTNVQSSLYVCKFCSHVLHSESDLHNHHIQYHKTVLKRVRKGDNSARPKMQKQQLFPPGCSPYRCTVCNRDFNRLENLKTHLRIHTGERPYTCSVCGVRFRHGGALTRHFRLHTGEKPYVCSECGRSFRNCGGLRYHQKSHSPAVYSLSK